MSRPALTTFQRLRTLYKANSFPWKKHVMVGWDLDGNEYWEMPDPNNPGLIKQSGVAYSFRLTFLNDRWSMETLGADERR